MSYQLPSRHRGSIYHYADHVTGLGYGGGEPIYSLDMSFSQGGDVKAYVCVAFQRSLLCVSATVSLAKASPVVELRFSFPIAVDAKWGHRGLPGDLLISSHGLVC